MAMFNLEPWDEAQDEWRAGMEASTVANSVRSKNSRIFQPADFMRTQFKDPGGDAQEKPKTQEQLAQKIDFFFAALGGKRGNAGNPDR